MPLTTRTDDIPDVGTKLHLHRITTSACRIQHILKLVPPNLSDSFAQGFHHDQLQTYSRFSLVPIPLLTKSDYASAIEATASHLRPAWYMPRMPQASLPQPALKSTAPATLMSMRTSIADVLVQPCVQLPPCSSLLYGPRTTPHT